MMTRWLVGDDETGEGVIKRITNKEIHFSPENRDEKLNLDDGRNAAVCFYSLRLWAGLSSQHCI